MSYDDKCRQVRCDNCGKFISVDDWACGKVIHEYVPDITERYESFCKRCVKLDKA